MASLIILFIPLLILAVLSLHEFHYLLSPTFAFIIGFVLQVFFCFFYTKEWSINLSGTTIGIIILGCTTFFLTSWLLQYSNIKIVFRRKKQNKNDFYYEEEILPFEIDKWKLILFIVMQALTLLGYIQFMNSNMVGGNLAAKIYFYRSQTADYGEVIAIPRYLSFFRLLSSAIGYSLLYVLAYNLVNKFKETNFLVFTNLILSLLLEGILGARGGMFNFIIAFVGIYFLLGYKYNRINISFKLLVRALAIGIAIISLLPILGNALGRPSIKGAAYDTAMYISGSMMNLDTFVKNTGSGYGSHYSTIYGLLNDFSNYLSENYIASQRLPVRWNYINGNSMGNVYTTFASFWYDMGWFGIFFLSLISAVIMYCIYRSVMSGQIKRNQIPLSAVLYSYLIPCILFSFFSNRFYSQLLSLYFVKLLIAIMFVKLLIENVRLSPLEKNQKIGVQR